MRRAVYAGAMLAAILTLYTTTQAVHLFSVLAMRPATRFGMSKSKRRPFASGLFLAASFVMAIFALSKLPLRGGEPPRLQWMPRFQVPGDDSFFVYSTGDEISHLVLYHDLGDSIENARRADILFLGNSRMPLGLREEVIVPEAAKLGLRVFSLATGHSEKVDFDLALIRKHNLRPKIVVAVGGPNYYHGGVSKRAAAAMKLTRWQAWKEWTEASSAWAFQRAVHSWLPKIDWNGQDLTSGWIIYRSARTGWWHPALEPAGRSPVKLAREDGSYERLLPEARKLKKELDSRGALLVLTMVPYGATRSGNISYLSHELDVPAVLPSFDGLSTSDGSHLNRESGERYAKEFWNQFIALPAVRQKLSLSGRGRRHRRCGKGPRRTAGSDSGRGPSDALDAGEVLRWIGRAAEELVPAAGRRAVRKGDRLPRRQDRTLLRLARSLRRSERSAAR